MTNPFLDAVAETFGKLDAQLALLREARELRKQTEAELAANGERPTERMLLDMEEEAAWRDAEEPDEPSDDPMDREEVAPW